MDGWNTSFLLGRPIFRGYVSFREGNIFQVGWNHQPEKVIPLMRNSQDTANPWVTAGWWCSLGFPKARSFCWWMASWGVSHPKILSIYIYMIMYHIFFYISGQIITTSAEVTLNGGLIRELPQNPLNSGLGIILICPDIYIYISFQSFMMEAEHATRKNRGDDPNLDMIIFRFHVKSVGSVFDIL